MEPDDQKVDAAVLALMYLTLHDEVRAWKGFPWEATDRLYENGFIENPVNQNKSVVLTEKGRIEAEKMFKRLLAKV
ncbi:DUF6429 family protein [Salinisphaera sp. Q1T1-3]|uniref:DUF6429 family protein n=1 Tax=Salinisphaera sp. Q1T1-3 TaxID=2321229 RepID=UPI000E73245A|nr:DUF6429 family protein [Salinisphaera sp. Q1T1-3]RJS91987.1 hypothetical protein D3260_13675 [Salinisphaera sp. Q1T1-3]